jgi:hypothetical protein
MIGAFGRNSEGVHTYRINTTKKEEIYEIIDGAKKAGWKFWDTPNIEKVHKTWSVLLKIYYPKELGYPEESN